MRAFTAAELAQEIQGRVVGDPSRLITGVATIEDAGESDLILATTPRHVQRAERSAASCILVPPGITAARKTLIQVENPRLALSKILSLYHPSSPAEPGVHPSAVLGREVRLGREVSIGPYAVIGNGVQVGEKVVIGPGCVVGDGSVIGPETILHPNVTLYPNMRLGARVVIHSGAVIGADGFGYVWDGHRHVKIPQVGTVLIEDDVEIGANTCIDRATLGSTVIRRGVRIDNLVQVAHNVSIGQHAVLVAQVGIAGSSEIGAGCLLGGQAGIADHVVIGDRAVVGAQSGVFSGKHVKAGEVVVGYPARPVRKTKEQLAALAQLPKLIDEVAALKKEIGRIRAEVSRDA